MPRIRMTISELYITVWRSVHLRWEDTHSSMKRQMLRLFFRAQIFQLSPTLQKESGPSLLGSVYCQA